MDWFKDHLDYYASFSFGRSMRDCKDRQTSALNREKYKISCRQYTYVANMASYAICSEFDFGDSWQHDHWD
jgi:hypothetical protein